MKRCYQISSLILILGLLSSCDLDEQSIMLSKNQPTSIVSTSRVPIPSLTPAADATLHPRTSTPFPKLTATHELSPSNNPQATKTDEHIYIDPEGWYAVNIPGDWRPGQTPNSFSSDDGFFETGYLLEMMYVEHRLDVCQWLANIDTKNTYSVSWTSTNGLGCKLTTLPGITPQIVLEVFQNPSADYAHRYFYIKVDAEHHDQIIDTFAWLQPVNEEPQQTYQDELVRPDDISFWENTSPIPTGLTITEYELPEEAQNENPGDEIFLQFIPQEALPEVTQSGGIYTPETMETVNETIMPFGYELKTEDDDYHFDLYKDGELVVKSIYKLPVVYLNSSGGTEYVAFILQTVKDINKSMYAEGNASTYLVQTNAVTLWLDKIPNPMLSWGRVIWASEDLLLLGLGDHIDLQVRNDNHDLVFSFTTYFGAQIPIKQFFGWNDHWILGVSDFIIQDGVILNEKYGFEGVYNWYLLNNKPFYFFRKGPRSGISYDGDSLSVHYQEIAHGYCCALGLNNPRSFENSVRFFGRRDGIWYYVVVEIE